MEEPQGEVNKESELPDLPLGEKLCGYIVVEQISEGACGRIYKCRSEDPNAEHKECVVKAESVDLEGGSTLKLEKCVLEAVKWIQVFPDALFSGKHKGYNFLGMTLLGADLVSVNTGNYSKGTWARIGIQCLYAIKKLHEKGWLHRDIKPRNFVMGHGVHNRVVYLIDYGMCREYIVKTERPNPTVDDGKTPREFLIPRRRLNGTQNEEYILRHLTLKDIRPVQYRSPPSFRAPRDKVPVRGTHGFMSMNACNGKEQGRVDDIWSLMYTLVDLVGELPWASTKSQVPPADLSLRELFKSHTKLQLKESHLEKLDEIDKTLRECDYYSFPSYYLVHEFLMEVLKETGESWSDPLDWEEKGKEYGTDYWYNWEEPGGYFEADHMSHIRRPRI